MIQSLPDPDLKSTSKTPGHTALGVSIAKEKGMGFFSDKVTFSFQTIQNSLYGLYTVRPNTAFSQLFAKVPIAVPRPYDSL